MDANDAGDSASFEAFVARRSPGLQRTAVLLVADRDEAEDALDAALMATCRHWRQARRGSGPYAYTRRTLVRCAVERRRRRTVQQIVDLTVDSPLDSRPGFGWEPADDVLLPTLTTLPPRTRAVLVLRYWEGLSDAEAAEVLGCPRGTVETEIGRGLGRLRSTIPPPGDVEEVLREELAARAGRVPPPSPDLCRTTVDGYRRALRRRTAVAAAALTAVLALVGVTLASDVLHTSAGPADVVPPAVRDLGVYEVSTRGSLAGDEPFVEGVRSIEWSPPMGWEGEWRAPEESDRRVLFAGEVPGGSRWALVMGQVGVQLLYVWFTGPADASGAALQPAAPPGRGGPDEPMTLMDEGRPDSTLVVVGLPGDEVTFSPDGSAWHTVPTDDGLAVGRVPPPASLADAELRITRADGDVVHRSALVHLRPGGPYLPPGAGPGPAEDPDGRQYGDRMRSCLLSRGWLVTAAAGGGAFLAGDDLGEPLRLLAFQQDRQQCEAVLGYRD